MIGRLMARPTTAIDIKKHLIRKQLKKRSNATHITIIDG
jgi:hypothetical protein